MSAPPRRALITGVTGQDGSFLAEQLLERGYEVVGLVRGEPSRSLGAAERLRVRLRLLVGDLADDRTLCDAVRDAAPREIYHLGAPTFVPASWEDPAGTLNAIYGSTAALLRAIAAHAPAARLFLACSGDMFGDASVSPQREDTPCRPLNPYATAKLAAHQLVGQLRDRNRVFACSGILYNHESERRPERFVTRKVTRAAAAIKLGLQDELVLGDVSAVRDWSFAGDVMHGAWLALQQDVPDDYVFASGIGHSVAELVDAAFGHVGLDPQQHLRTDPALARRREAVAPIGDPTRARERLGWSPTLDFATLVARMVDADLRRLSGGGTG